MADHPKKTDEFLNVKERDLSFILQKIKHIEAINRLVQSQLETAYADQCRVANIEGDTLTLLTAHSSLATPLRFQTPTLLNAFKKHPLLSGIKHIHVKVRTLSHTRHTQKNTRQVESVAPETVAMIETLAEGIEDPELRAIMKKIANSAKNREYKS